MAENGKKVDQKRLKQELLNLAAAIRRLDEEGELLHASPELIRLMGDLRRKLFEYEVRCTERLLPRKELPEVLEAQQIVRDEARRLEEEDEKWRRLFEEPGEEG